MTRSLRFLITSFLVGALIAGVDGPAEAATIPDEAWVTDGVVNSFAFANGKVYLGGSFSQVGPNTGGGTLVHPASGVYDEDYFRIDGRVHVVIPDGTGGWYIGGDFIYVEDRWRPRVAHIFPNGSVSSWRPLIVGNRVTSLALDGDTLYVGGAFDAVDGEDRANIASLDVSTEAVDLDPWNPGTNGEVGAMAIGGGELYVGGDFTSIGGSARNRLAAIDLGNGSVTGWNPGANGRVETVAVASGNGSVYVGGAFSSVGGASRDQIAELNANNGNATAWNPNANGTVRSIVEAPGGSRVYVGGDFSTIGGASREHLAELRANDGSATSWSPDVDGRVRAVAVAADGDGVYIAGDFRNAGTKRRRFLAEIDRSTGTASSWTPDANGLARAIGVSSTGVYVGGAFSSVNGVARSNLAALDATTGVLDPTWAPTANDDVLAIDVSPNGSRVYAGGRFTEIDGATQNRIVALNATTGSRIAKWKASTNSTVWAIRATGSYVYLGGDFTSANSASRRRLAAFDTTNGGVHPTFSPSVDNRVRTMAMAPNGRRLYVAGDFNSIDGVTRHKIAAINVAASKVDTGWQAETNRETFRIVANSQGVYAAMGGAGGRAYSFDPVSGATNWFVDADGDVQAIEVAGGVAYIGGHFDLLAGQNRTHLGAANATTGVLRDDWQPSTNGAMGVIHMARHAGQVWIGGDFDKATSRSAEGIARFGQASGNFELSYAETVTLDGADIYWRLGDGGKRTADAVNGIEARYRGSPSVRSAGLVATGADDAVRLNGRNERIVLPDDPRLNVGAAYRARTIEVWFEADDVSTRRVIFEAGAGRRGMSMYVDEGRLYMGAWSVGDGPEAWGTAFVSAPIGSASTHHAVLVLDAATGTLHAYLDGAEIDVVTGVGSLPRHPGNAAIGHVRGGTRFHDGPARRDPAHGFAGRVDEFALYNLVLSPMQIAMHHALGVGNIGAVAPGG